MTRTCETNELLTERMQMFCLLCECQYIWHVAHPLSHLLSIIHRLSACQYSLQWLVRLLMIYSWVYLPSVLWYCWLGLLTCKNRLPYNLYCVGGDVKHCSLTHSLSWKYSGRGGLVDSRYHMCELYGCCNHVLLRVLLSVAHSMTLDTVNCSSQGM